MENRGDFEKKKEGVTLFSGDFFEKNSKSKFNKPLLFCSDTLFHFFRYPILAKTKRDIGKIKWDIGKTKWDIGKTKREIVLTKREIV